MTRQTGTQLGVYWASWHAVAAALDELRDESRFKAMLKRVNLPE